MSETGGVNAVPVDLNTTSGSGTLVYQVDRTNGIVTVSAVDITTAAGQATITNNLVAGTPVKVFGIPQANATIKAYVVIYYTGSMPSATSVD
jgi:phosphoribosylcarboxyaminoimidazole (NCAIR) mutase